jgi:methionyl-tRNA formyltransferase
MLRVVYFGNSGSIFSNSCFQDLLETPSEVVAVVDTPPAKRVSTNARGSGAIPDFGTNAKAHRIPVLEPENPNVPGFVQSLSAQSPDLFVAAGYMSLLKEQILAVPKIAAVNFHASLLPAYRGKHPVFWALRHGERWSGMTVHVMDRGLDTGGILYQVRVRTRKDDTVESLYERILKRSSNLLRPLIDDAGRGRLRPRAQQDAGASYYSAVHEDDFRLEWSQAAEVLRRWIHVSPGRCFCETRYGRIYMADAVVVPCRREATAGTLLLVNKFGCTVRAGDGAVRVRSMHLDQQGVMPAAQLCVELGLRVGDTMGRD